MAATKTRGVIARPAPPPPLIRVPHTVCRQADTGPQHGCTVRPCSVGSFSPGRRNDHPSIWARKYWGDEGFAREELVAELGSAFLCADLGLAPEILEDHAAYIDSWLKVLKDDKRFVFTAASHPQRAAGYLHSLQNVGLDEAETEAA